MKYRKFKIIWEGFSWFIAGVVVSLGILIVVVAPAMAFDVQWLAVVGFLALVVTPLLFSIRAVIKERRRQVRLGLTDVPVVIIDPVLGELKRSDIDAEMWETTIRYSTDQFSIMIAAEGRPDPALLLRARRLVEDAPGFLSRLVERRIEIVKTETWMAPFADEVRGLRVDSVIFYEPAKPEEASIYFKGEADDRCWHGSLVDFHLVALGCET